jgi:hypothetical protein
MKIHPVGTSCSMRTDDPTNGQTASRPDRHTKANSRFSQFYERAYKLHDIGGAVPSKTGKSSVVPSYTEHTDGRYCDLLIIVTYE